VIGLTITGDTKYENNETISILLDNITGAPNASPVGFLTVQNDDTAPVLTVESTTSTRAQNVDFYAWFRLRTNVVSGSQITLRYATQPISATPGEDYEAKTGTVTFEPGERTKWVAIPLIEDDVAKPDLSFRLVISQLQGATQSTASSQGVGTIKQLRVIQFRKVVEHLFLVKFPTGLGQSYIIEVTDDLTTEDWAPMSGAIAGSGKDVSYTQFCEAEKCFFRVRAISTPPGN
jgi:hypothetical protein